MLELSRLHQSVYAQTASDEVKSADSTFNIAEHYFQINDLEQAERFFLLTIQKSRIILNASKKQEAVATSTAINPPPTPPATAEESPNTPVTTLSEAQYQMPHLSTTEPTPAPDAVTAPSAVIKEASVASSEPEDGYFYNNISSEKLVGTASIYSVEKNDTIRLVAAKLGVSRQYLINKNKLDEKNYLKIGQKLLYNNRKIIPQRMKDGIVVNIPDRTLYLFKHGKLVITLPVALGVPVKSDKYDWKTPTGKFKITAKMKDPTWRVPPSIQSEMEEQGKEVITSIPPGLTNPLGKYAIRTSIPGILIHSTIKPWSIYSFASHGCIRVYPQQMEELFNEVTVNTPGEIIYKPVKLAITEDGRVFLEVHRDVYGKSSNGLAIETRRLIERKNISKRVDWRKVDSIVRQSAGIAEDISL